MINENLNIIICSKNRPMQLYALLESLTTYTNIDPKNVFIVFKVDESNEDYITAMNVVFDKFQNINYLKETIFESQIKNILNSMCTKKYTMFMMDDQLIKDKIDFNECIQFAETNNAFCFSLRLGLNTTQCYPVNCEQGLPKDFIEKDNCILWDYTKGKLDWNYPISLDTHIMSTNLWRQMINHIGFNNPNTLEANLQLFMNNLPLLCAAYKESKSVNIPMNKVQSVFNNRFSNDSDLSESNLLIKFVKESLKIDVQATVYGKQTNAAHTELPIVLVERV